MCVERRNFILKKENYHAHRKEVKYYSMLHPSGLTCVFIIRVIQKMEIIKKTRNKKEASKTSITDAFKASFIKSNYIHAPIEFSCMDYESYLFCNVTRT